MICEMIAKLIVHPEEIGEEFDTDFLTSCISKYIKYSKLLTRVEKSMDLRLNLVDNVQKLLGFIQEERAKLKHIYKFVNEARHYLPAMEEEVYYMEEIGDHVAAKVEVTQREKPLGLQVTPKQVITLATPDMSENDDDIDTSVLNGMISAFWMVWSLYFEWNDLCSLNGMISEFWETVLYIRKK